MLRSELELQLKRWRDNDVVVNDSHDRVIGTHYDPTYDAIVIRTEEFPYTPAAFINELVARLTELDRGLQHSDVGHSVWYEDWRKRVEGVLGLIDGELNSSVA